MDETSPLAARGPPENQDKWVKSTASAMCRARIQASEMHTRLQNYEMAEAANKRAAGEEAARQKERKKKAAKSRVSAHVEVINGSQSAIKAIEDATQRLEDVLTRLTHERYARYADFQVNVRRSEMREARPKCETFRDHLQVNLEKEKAVLSKSRTNLLEREAAITVYRKKLVELRQQLSRDTGSRRLQVEHELAALKPGLLSHQVTTLPPIDGASPPADAEPVQEPPPPAPAAEEESAPPPSKRGEDKAIINSAITLLTGVDEFCEAAEVAIDASRRSGKEATCLVVKSLARRTVDLAAVKKELEDHIGDTMYAIQVGERSIEKQKRRLDPRDTAKKQKLETTCALQDGLEATLRELQEDLRGKIAALDIDNACRRVTPQVAAEKRRPTTADIKNKTLSGKLNGSASAPNLNMSGTEFTDGAASRVSISNEVAATQ